MDDIVGKESHRQKYQHASENRNQHIAEPACPCIPIRAVASPGGCMVWVMYIRKMARIDRVPLTNPHTAYFQ